MMIEDPQFYVLEKSKHATRFTSVVASLISLRIVNDDEGSLAKVALS